jgi:hypothetical protein
MDPYFRSLPVKLTEDERLARAKDAAAKVAEYAAIETQKKALTSELTAKMKELRSETETLSQAVSSGIEYQPVEVVQHRNEERSLIETVRLDTSEIIDSRPMTVAERQAELFETAEPTSSRRIRREDA